MDPETQPWVRRAPSSRPSSAKSATAVVYTAELIPHEPAPSAPDSSELLCAPFTTTPYAAIYDQDQVDRSPLVGDSFTTGDTSSFEGDAYCKNCKQQLPGIIDPCASHNPDFQPNRDTDPAVLDSGSPDQMAASGEAGLGISRRKHKPESYILLSLIVTVCFNLPVGLCAVLLSFQAHKAFQRQDKKTGQCRARCALVTSMFGIVVTVAAMCTVVMLVASRKSD